MKNVSMRTNHHALEILRKRAFAQLIKVCAKRELIPYSELMGVMGLDSTSYDDRSLLRTVLWGIQYLDWVTGRPPCTVVAVCGDHEKDNFMMPGLPFFKKMCSIAEMKGSLDFLDAAKRRDFFEKARDEACKYWEGSPLLQKCGESTDPANVTFCRVI